MEQALNALLIAYAVWVVVGAAISVFGAMGLRRLLSVSSNSPAAKSYSILIGIGMFAFFVVLAPITPFIAIAPIAMLAFAIVGGYGFCVR